MAKKSVREMSSFSRWRNSLSVRTFQAVLFLTLGIGLIAFTFGTFLYVEGITREYCINTSDMAASVRVSLDVDEVRAKTEQILRIYDSMTDEEKGDGTSKQYRKKYRPVLDKEFFKLKNQMYDIMTKLGLRNSFIVALDLDSGRMIYMIDADQHPDTVCYPGTWDVYQKKDLEVLVNGIEVSELETRYGLRTDIQATITSTDKWGIRCTGASTLYETDKYSVMLCLDEKIDHVYQITKLFLRVFVSLILALTLAAAGFGVFLLRKSTVKPINKLARAAQAYTDSHTASKHTGEETKQKEKTFFQNLKIRPGDEIENLALTMKDMENDMAVYVDDLTRITAEKERISTELSLAKRIQMDMLPSTFPAFPDHEDFDIYATSKPAREVGGDFYDFFMVDEDHLAVLIADVSGKGIPAALFMMVSKIILNNKAMDGLSPAQVMNSANDIICVNNKEEMFVTVWLGILELSTGKIVAANAGHEKPIIIHADGSVELMNDKHGFVVGGMEGMNYSEYEFRMEPGSKIFVYTDGVPEATFQDGLFGIERTLEAVGKAADQSPKGVLIAVQEAVDDFVKTDEQFDDLTMLCLEYKGVNHKKK